MKSAEEIRAEHEEYQAYYVLDKYKELLTELEANLEHDIRSPAARGYAEIALPTYDLRLDTCARTNHRLIDYLISKGYRLSIGPNIHYNQTTVIYVYWR